MGQRAKLTKQIHETIVAAVRAGNYFSVACELAGISAITGHEWVSRGNGTHKTRPNAPIYAKFAKDIAIATAEAEQMAVESVVQALKGRKTVGMKIVTDPDGKETRELRQEEKIYPQMAAWYLKVKHPERWSESERMRQEATRMVNDWITEVLDDEEIPADVKLKLARKFIPQQSEP